MKTNNSKKTRALPALILAVVAVIAGLWLVGDQAAQPALLTNPGEIAVHFIDVGQGDCTLIEAQGHFMLIDGGERGSEDAVIKYLNNQGVKTLDYVVATHPHSDHIGGLAYGILEAFPVGTVIAPRFSQENTPTTNTYEIFLDAVSALAANGTKALYAKPGDQYTLGDASFTILGPLSEDGKNYNNDSVALRADYQNSAAVFTGDAEQSAEKAMVQQWGAGLQAGLLKGGHHGSKTSSCEEFLSAVQPVFFVASCGIGNSYGHPSQDILDRCAEMGIRVHRTDTSGTIVFVSDGTAWALAS